MADTSKSAQATVIITATLQQSVIANSPSIASIASKVAAYISRDTARPSRTVMVVINRSNTVQDVGYQGLTQQGTATLYRLDGTANATNPTPILAGSVSLNLATWVVSLPAYSVSTIVVE